MKNQNQKQSYLMKKIPLNKSSEKLQTGIILRHITMDEEFAVIPHPHRDDYYIFLFQESGVSSTFIDFEEYQIIGAAVGCVLPGQVHIAGKTEHVRGWFLAVDDSLISNEYRNTLEGLLYGQTAYPLPSEVAQDLTACLSTLQRRLQNIASGSSQKIIHALVSACIGMIAEIVQCSTSLASNKRYATITIQFKTLLATHFRSLKRPQEYAALLNISTVYLNEAVKSTTGISVSEYIQKEIILEAKRLLYYTDMNVKEIAFALGYNDYAYFSKLFTKVTGMNPTSHRKKYHE